MSGLSTSPKSTSSECLQHLHLDAHYHTLKDIGTGTYGKVIFAVCRETGTKVALKMLPKATTSLREFQREFSFSYFLSPHKNIVNSYDVAFETGDQYVFAQEQAPMGDLFNKIKPQLGMDEGKVKKILRQVTSALDFMHSKNIVHRDIKPENILIFDAQFDLIKLVDFGLTRKSGTMVRKQSGCMIPYTPPEVCEAVRNENYSVEASADVWAMGVLLFSALTGNFPWERADALDTYYNEFSGWQKRKTCRIPSQWKTFTPRVLRLFRRLLEPKPSRRCCIKEVYKYLDDRWISKKVRSGSEEDIYMMTSSTSSEDLNELLKKYGIDTTISRRFREKRVQEWVLST